MNVKPVPPSSEFASEFDHIVIPIANHFRGRPATPEAVLWPNAADLLHRFDALTSGVNWDRYDTKNQLRLLDVGCGPGFLLDYLNQIGVLDKISYVGIDLNPEMISAAAARWPNHHFLVRDIRTSPFEENAFHVAIFCGVFTCRFTLSETAMTRLMTETLASTWPSVKDYLAYNVMSKHLDWERPDLFHYPIDAAVSFAHSTLKTRNVRIKHDYGLYEYSCLLFRHPNLSPETVPPAWIDPTKS